MKGVSRENKVLKAIAYIKKTKIITSEEILALLTANIALKDNLAQADTAVYATTLLNNGGVDTADSDSQYLPCIVFLPKS